MSSERGRGASRDRRKRGARRYGSKDWRASDDVIEEMLDALRGEKTFELKKLRT